MMLCVAREQRQEDCMISKFHNVTIWLSRSAVIRVKDEKKEKRGHSPTTITWQSYDSSNVENPVNTGGTSLIGRQQVWWEPILFSTCVPYPCLFSEGLLPLFRWDNMFQELQNRQTWVYIHGQVKLLLILFRVFWKTMWPDCGIEWPNSMNLSKLFKTWFQCRVLFL